MQAVGQDIGPGFQQMGHLNIPAVLMLDQKLIELHPEIRIENLELILKQQFHQGTSTLHPLIAIIVTIIQFGGVINAIYQLFHH
jgi:hypothetical protein